MYWVAYITYSVLILFWLPNAGSVDHQVPRGILEHYEVLYTIVTIIQKLYGGFTYAKSFTEEPWKNSISSKNWGEARMLTFSPSFYYRDRLGQQNSLQQLNWKTMDTGITFLRYRQWHLLPSSSPPGLSTLVNQPRNNTVTSKWPAWYLHQCTEGENDKNQLKANWQHQNQKHSVFTNKSK